MTLLDALQQSYGLLLVAVALLGLIIGSFLNVVILRLPRMMEQAWKSECRVILELPEQQEPALSLTSPPSCCPSCGTGIKPWHNIPLLGWLLLRGRCSQCKTPISVQYPIVEAVSGVASVICAMHFGYGPQLLAALVLTWVLITLTVIDLRTMLLPDSLTLPLLWLGLLLALNPVFATLQSAVIGAAAGYLSLWSVFQLFKLITGKEGMGFGDFKLFAALGAWLGWQALPLILLLSSVVGAAVGIGLLIFNRKGRDLPLPFGPYLAGAGWIALIWGDALTETYLRISGLR